MGAREKKANRIYKGFLLELLEKSPHFLDFRLGA